MKKLRAKMQNRGYTLIFAIFIAILVLGVAAFIVGVARKQFILSVTSRDSIYALYSADSVIECAAQAGAAGWANRDNGITPSSQNLPCSTYDGQIHFGVAARLPYITFTEVTDNNIKSTLANDLDTAQKVYQIANVRYTGGSNPAPEDFARFLLRDVSSSDSLTNIIGCARLYIYIGVDKNGVPRTVLDARGYNLCDQAIVATTGISLPDRSANIRTVERAIRVIE